MKSTRIWLMVVLTTGLGFLSACTENNSGNDDYVDRMAHEHADDSPEATGLVAEPAGPVEVKEVSYGPGLRGVLATPAGKERGLPGLVVIHEWWGLNDNVKAMARRLAGEGYAALAVDLYGGKVAQTPDEAMTLTREAGANEGASRANLESAYAYLVDEVKAPRVGSIGWCFGGGMSLTLALARPAELDAAVIYYGRLVTDPALLDPLQMPILGIFGAEDQGIPVASARAFEAALEALGKDATIVVYEGADHAFANPSGQNYQPEAAEDAWDKTLAFLSRTLKD